MTTPPNKPWEHNKSGTAGSEEDLLAARFVSSLDFDTRLYVHDIDGSLAHAQMLQAQGLIDMVDLKAITKGLTQIRQEIEEQGTDWPGFQIELEDVHMCIEAALIEKIGDPGRKLHTGRSRNDQVALDLVLWVRQSAGELTGALLDLNDTFVALAEAQGETVMPSYTHLQRAQPIALGAECMAWVSALSRATLRLAALTQINLASPLGAGAVAGSTLPLDRSRTAAALDLPALALNSIDATANRDAAIDFAYALSMISMTLSRWAEQWILYCTTEFGFLKLGAAYTTGSSMMPQKQNPDMLELIRGKTGIAYGSLIALLTMTKGLPLAYNRDLQDDKRHLFDSFDAVMDCVDMAVGIVGSAQFQTEHIAAGLDRGYLDATVLAEYLVSAGVPFRTGHQIVGRLVSVAEERGLGRLAALSLEDFNAACGEHVTLTEDVFDHLGAANVVKRYQSAGNGGSGAGGYQQQIETYRQFAAPLDPEADEDPNEDPDDDAADDFDDEDDA